MRRKKMGLASILTFAALIIGGALFSDNVKQMVSKIPVLGGMINNIKK